MAMFKGNSYLKDKLKAGIVEKRLIG